MSTFTKAAQLIAHIEGPSGSGKTTLLHKLKAKHPSLIIKDTDEFSQGGSPNWKPRAETARRKKLLDDFLAAHKGSPIILGGSNIRPNMPGYHVVGKIPAEHKILIDTSPLVSSLRRLNRNWHKPKERVADVPRNWRRAQELRAEAKRRGYSERNLVQIEDLVADALGRNS